MLRQQGRSALIVRNDVPVDVTHKSDDHLALFRYLPLACSGLKRLRNGNALKGRIRLHIDERTISTIYF
jgi:hypothetical protein